MCLKGGGKLTAQARIGYKPTAEIFPIEKFTGGKAPPLEPSIFLKLPQEKNVKRYYQVY